MNKYIIWTFIGLFFQLAEQLRAGKSKDQYLDLIYIEQVVVM